MNAQIPLGLRLHDSATFENFFAQGNELLVDALRLLHEPYIYLWGSLGSGKSHLLQAVCHAVSEQNRSSVYLPLADIKAFSPAMLEGLEQLQVICLDDVQQLVGQDEWETALFNLYNRVRERGARLLVAGNVTPTALSLQLADLLSRLSWGPVFQLQGLSDSAKPQALQMRAAARGLILPDEVADYLLKRCPRDMQSLFDMLEKLDEASLIEQRKLTIPFVRRYI